jgi:hypothetical protein
MRPKNKFTRKREFNPHAKELLGLELKFDPTNVVSTSKFWIFYFYEYYRFLLTG